MCSSTRHRRQPQIEGLELRMLLSAGSSAHTAIAQSVTNNGSTNSGDPDFIPVVGRSGEQTRAAFDVLRVEHQVLFWYAEHDKASHAANRLLALGPDEMVSSAQNPFEAFEKIFGKEQSQTIENFYNAVGPANPFDGLPKLTQSQLKPGDIIATTGTNALSQATRIGTWSRFSHVALYLGDGMIEDARGPGVLVRPLDDLLASSSVDGVMRDTAVTDTQLASVVADALKFENKPYNYDGFSAIATHKAAGLARVARHGITAMIGVLSRAETLPASLTNGDSYWCSQMVLAAYADAGIPFNIANGASPGDVVRLAETGALDEVGTLPVGGQPAG